MINCHLDPEFLIGLSDRWRSLALSSPLLLALWLSLSCIGWMVNVEDKIFLRGPRSTLWLEAFSQCPGHSNGRHLRSGEENTVRDGSTSGRPLSYHLMLCADSDIIHVNVLGTSMVILNSYKVATELLDQRSSTYSSRQVDSNTLFQSIFFFYGIFSCFI